MKKYKSLLLVLVLFAGVLLLAGCTKGKEKDKEKKEEEKTATIKANIGSCTISLNVPVDEEGNAKYEFTTTKPEGFKRNGSAYLVLDKTTLAFSTTSWVYQTSVKYKESHETIEPSYADYLEWMDNANSGIKLYGMEKLKTDDGRDGIRYYAREGSSNDYKYYGYNYLFSLDDINKKARIEGVAYYNDEETPTEAKEFDAETLKVIKSLKAYAPEK